MNSTTPATEPNSPTRVVIVHGYGATPRDHWFPWLRHTLARDGIAVSVPELPDPETPNTTTWERTVADSLGQPDAGTWVVAHSLGGITTLRALAARRDPWQLGGLVLVSGFTGRLAALPALDEYLATDVDADWLSRHITARHMIRSDDDLFVPPAASDQLARRLHADLHVITGGRHFLADDGFATLPALLPILPTDERATAGQD